MTQSITKSFISLAALASLEITLAGCQSLERSIYSRQNPNGYIVVEGRMHGDPTSEIRDLRTSNRERDVKRGEEQDAAGYFLSPSRRGPLGPLSEGVEISVGINLFRFIEYLNGRDEHNGQRHERRKKSSAANANLFLDTAGARPTDSDYFLVRD